MIAMSSRTFKIKVLDFIISDLVPYECNINSIRIDYYTLFSYYVRG